MLVLVLRPKEALNVYDSSELGTEFAAMSGECMTLIILELQLSKYLLEALVDSEGHLRNIECLIMCAKAPTKYRVKSMLND